MKTVLQPLNEKAKDIIVNHSDLLEAHSVEPLLLQLVAHVSAYKVILSRCETCALTARIRKPCIQSLLGHGWVRQGSRENSRVQQLAGSGKE